jgi:hypothetical protein
LFNVRFFRYATGLHPGFVGAPFRSAVLRGLGEGRRCGDAAYNSGGNKQTILDLHARSPDCLLTR